jgi:hypothetical protein
LPQIKIEKIEVNSIYDCNLLQLPKENTGIGSITAYENKSSFPFAIKRCFYLFDVPSGERRGGHAHLQLSQFVIAASGSFDIILEDGANTRVISLNQPSEGVYIPFGIWNELVNFSSGATCLVFASDVFKESDYIRSKTEFNEYRLNLQATLKTY